MEAWNIAMQRGGGGECIAREPSVLRSSKISNETFYCFYPI